MKLRSVYEPDGSFTFGTANFLYSLLGEREPEQSISHKTMPTFAEHLLFIESHPYAWWFVAEQDGQPCGSVYLTRAHEVGIAISRSHRGRGLGSLALGALVQKAKSTRLLANINPANAASIALFRKHGFGGPIQLTLEKP